ncbi:hypothetical protein I552_7518 [Mycobacterium xenopi 3993]|nr:hypothetical protein I552_7518 [Mycobacterium xenopi 3993]
MRRLVAVLDVTTQRWSAVVIGVVIGPVVVVTAVEGSDPLTGGAAQRY